MRDLPTRNRVVLRRSFVTSYLIRLIRGHGGASKNIRFSSCDPCHLRLRISGAFPCAMILAWSADLKCGRPRRAATRCPHHANVDATFQFEDSGWVRIGERVDSKILETEREIWSQDACLCISRWTESCAKTDRGVAPELIVQCCQIEWSDPASFLDFGRLFQGTCRKEKV